MRAAADLWIRQLCIEPADQILDVLDRLRPDVWLVHPSLYWLVEMAAARDEAPVAVGHLSPMMVPSREHAPPSMPSLPSHAFNRLAWRAGRSMTGRMMFDREINGLRATRGLGPVTGNVGALESVLSTGPARTAQALAAQLAEENGPASAAQYIEALTQ